MKVDRVVEKVMSIIRNEEAERKQGAGQKTESHSSAAKDEVRISALIQQLNQSLSSGEITTGRSEKLSALKAEIEAGTYCVSGQAVAEKMLGMRGTTK